MRVDKVALVGIVLAIVFGGGYSIAQIGSQAVRITGTQGARVADVDGNNRLATTAYQGGAWTVTTSTPAMQDVNVAQVGGVAVLADVPVSVASLPLPAGAATDVMLTGISSQLPAALVGGRFAVDTGAVDVTGSSVAVSGTVTTAETPATSYGAEQVDATASAQQLASHSARAACVKNLESSTLPVYLGDASVTTTNGDELSVGESRCFSIDNTSRVYVRASGVGSRVSFSWVN